MTCRYIGGTELEDTSSQELALHIKASVHAARGEKATSSPNPAVKPMGHSSAWMTRRSQWCNRGIFIPGIITNCPVELMNHSIGRN